MSLVSLADIHLCTVGALIDPLSQGEIKVAHISGSLPLSIQKYALPLSTQR
jgi:hypothetical protein